MRYPNELKIGDVGYVIYKDELQCVTVSSIDDISRHGSPCDVIFVKEISGEWFHKLYDCDEAIEIHKSNINKKINKLKNEKDKFKQEIKSLKTMLKSL